VSQTIRLFIADDNELVVDALRRVLRDVTDVAVAGYSPDTEDLVRKVRDARADVVLLDVDMPPGDTFHALLELTEALPNVRTVILSGHVRQDYFDRAVEAGAMGYLSKHADTKAILDGIRRVAAGEFATDGEDQV
jgi:DNA-binding NarL/FixJ family response regulator